MAFDLSKLHSLISTSMKKNDLHDENSVKQDRQKGPNDNRSGVSPSAEIAKQDSCAMELDSPTRKSCDGCHAIQSSAAYSSQTNSISRPESPLSKGMDDDHSSNTKRCDLNSHSLDDVEMDINSLVMLLFWDLEKSDINENEKLLCQEILLTFMNIFYKKAVVIKQEKNYSFPIVWDVVNQDGGPIVSFKYYIPHEEELCQVKEEATPPCDGEPSSEFEYATVETNKEPTKSLDVVEKTRTHELVTAVERGSKNNLEKIIAKSNNVKSNPKRTVCDSLASEGAYPPTQRIFENPSAILPNKRRLPPVNEKDAMFFKRKRIKAYSCSVCGNKYGTGVLLNIHALKHKKFKRFQCAICPRRYSVLHLFRKHIACHRTNGRYPRKCYKRKQLRNKKARQSNLNHLKSCSDNLVTIPRVKSVAEDESVSVEHNKLVLTCRFCFRIFDSRRHCNLHQLEHSARPKTHKCDDCGRNYTTMCDLQKHQFHHHGKAFEPCKSCDQQRLSYNVSSGETPAKWISRKTVRKTQSPLTCHVAGTIHGCDVCSKKFTTSCELQSHKNIHTNTNLQVQKYCNKCVETRMSA